MQRQRLRVAVFVRCGLQGIASRSSGHLRPFHRWRRAWVLQSTADAPPRGKSSSGRTSAGLLEGELQRHDGGLQVGARLQRGPDVHAEVQRQSLRVAVLVRRGLQGFANRSRSHLRLVYGWWCARVFQCSADSRSNDGPGLSYRLSAPPHAGPCPSEPDHCPGLSILAPLLRIVPKQGPDRVPIRWIALVHTDSDSGWRFFGHVPLLPLGGTPPGYPL
mmetsp:Transcript_44548/g.141950  ORF Transcript_44548/g.141950 Transcript_44548/m.141950 type:complete len:218 (-) Transcript_44548:53-706(-)